MPDALMFQEEMYVVLVPGEEEVFLTPEEMLERLKSVLSDHQTSLPPDLQKFAHLDDQARHLRDTACEFEVRPGERMQWYIVRLSK